MSYVNGFVTSRRVFSQITPQSPTLERRRRIAKLTEMSISSNLSCPLTLRKRLKIKGVLQSAAYLSFIGGSGHEDGLASEIVDEWDTGSNRSEVETEFIGGRDDSVHWVEERRDRWADVRRRPENELDERQRRDFQGDYHAYENTRTESEVSSKPTSRTTMDIPRVSGEKLGAGTPLLLASDRKARKVLLFSAETSGGRFKRDVITGIAPFGVTSLDDVTIAVVDSSDDVESDVPRRRAAIKPFENLRTNRLSVFDINTSITNQRVARGKTSNNRRSWVLNSVGVAGTNECLYDLTTEPKRSCVRVVSTVEGGNVTASWGEGLTDWVPRGVARTRRGHLVVTNVHPSGQAQRLGIFTPDGRQVESFGRAAGPGDLSFHAPHHVIVDAFGRILATDALGDCVKVYDARRGQLISQFGDRAASGAKGRGGSCPTLLDGPRAISVDSRDNVLVCDTGNSRLAVFSPDGRFVSAAGLGGGGANCSPLASATNNEDWVAVTLQDGRGAFRKVALYQSER